MRGADRPLAAGGAGRPSFGLANRLTRVAWKLAWLLLAAWTPPGFSPWRILLLRCFGATAGPGAAVAASVSVWLPRNLVLGAGASIGPGVDCYNMAPVTIGARTVISQRAFLCAGTHDIADPNFRLLVRPITVGRDAWVAAEAFVGPGVRLGDGCVLGARSCAFTDLESWTVYRGNPASPVKPRRWRSEEKTQPRVADRVG